MRQFGRETRADVRVRAGRVVIEEAPADVVPRFAAVDDALVQKAFAEMPPERGSQPRPISPVFRPISRSRAAMILPQARAPLPATSDADAASKIRDSKFASLPP